MKIQIDTTLVNALKLNYELSNPILDAPKDGLDGNTFIVTDGQKKCVAKLYNDSLAADITAQFQNSLSLSNVPVPTILPNKSGGLITKLGSRGVVLSEFIYGNPIGWGKQFASISQPITLTIAVTVANMHKVSQAMNKGPLLDHELSVSRIISRFGGRLNEELSARSLSSVRQIMIYGDLARENILLNQSMDFVKAIIDFGDAHYDYITYDIATLLTQVYVTRSWGIDFQGIASFLAKYNEINTLNAAELKTLLPLMEARNKALREDVKKQISDNSPALERLESIKQSLEFKFELLEKNRQRLEAIILKI